MSKKFWILSTFFIVLILGFYFTLTKVIPGYGEKSFQVLNNIKPFSFTNQDGEKITEADIDGKVYVAEYFFTTCPGICPILNTNMKEIYELYKSNDNFVILSHTCDPDTDSASRLKFYADSLNVDTKKWWFLTGSKDSLYDAARISYLLDDPKNNSGNIDEQFLHTQYFALIDKNGQVRRKIYDGLKREELNELKNDIGVLLREPRREKRFVNNLFGN